jgi:putative chromate ion transporter
MMTVDQVTPAQTAAPTFNEALKVWFKIGCLSFGGPAGQIAMMHRVLVDETKWIDEPRFLHALSFSMLTPGPEAQKLATYIGWLLHGVRGGLTAGILFVLPGALVMLGLSLLYVLGRGIAAVDGALFGIKAAVLVIVVEALIRIGKRALKTSVLLGMAGAAFVGIFFLALPFPIIVVATALLGFAVARSSPALLGLKDDVGTLMPPVPDRWRQAGTAAVIGLAAWWLPVGLAILLLGSNHVLVDIGLFFSKLAVVSFGGAYALLAYMAQQAVETHHRMTAPEMVGGLGLAETTAGPLILVTQFVRLPRWLPGCGAVLAGHRGHSRRGDDHLGHVHAIDALGFRGRAVRRAVARQQAAVGRTRGNHRRGRRRHSQSHGLVRAPRPVRRSDRASHGLAALVCVRSVGNRSEDSGACRDRGPARLRVPPELDRSGGRDGGAGNCRAIVARRLKMRRSITKT